MCGINQMLRVRTKAISHTRNVSGNLAKLSSEILSTCPDVSSTLVSSLATSCSCSSHNPVVFKLLVPGSHFSAYQALLLSEKFNQRDKISGNSLSIHCCTLQEHPACGFESLLRSGGVTQQAWSAFQINSIHQLFCVLKSSTVH